MDPAMMGGAPMDPSMMGGAPPMDPAMMAGAPMDPAMMGGGGAPPTGVSAEEVRAIVQEAMGSGGGGEAGGVSPIKPKIDVNIELLRMNKMLARIADALGVQIPAHEMIATQDDLTSYGMQSGGASAPGGGGGGSAIGAIPPMQGASPELAQGGKTASHDSMFGLRDRASAVAALIAARKGDRC